MRWMRAAVVVCAILAAGVARGDVQYNILARTGQPAPGAPFNFQRVSAAAFQADGSLMFQTNNDYLHPVLSEIRGVFQKKGATLRPIAYETEQIPGFPAGRIYLDLGYAHAGPDGTIVLGCGIGQSDDVLTSADSSFIGSDPQSMSFLAHAGDPVPGMPGASIGSAGTIRTGANGEVAFSALSVVPNVSEQWQLLAGRPGNLRVLAKEGDPAPGVSGSVLDQPFALAIGNNGDVFYEAGIVGPGPSYSSGVFAANAAGSRLITRDHSADYQLLARDIVTH